MNLASLRQGDEVSITINDRGSIEVMACMRVVVKGKAELGVIESDHVVWAFGLRKEGVTKSGVAFREGT